MPAWGNPNDQWHQGGGVQSGGLYQTPIPYPDLYAQAAAAANAAYSRALAQINEQRTNLLHSYGYLGDIAGSGVVKNIRVDPKNPYGKFQLMLRNQAFEDESAQNQAQDRGLHGGLANQAYTNLKFTHGGESAQLGQELTGGLSDFQKQQNDAQYQRDQALYQAMLEQLTLALQQGNFNPPIITDDTSGPVANTPSYNGLLPGYLPGTYRVPGGRNSFG